MTIKTTINITEYQYLQISIAAGQLSVSKSFLVNELVKIILNTGRKKSYLLQRVSYQKRLDKHFDSWHPMPVSFVAALYEKCHDLRRICKRSVSCLISEAIDEYLMQLVDDLRSGLAGSSSDSNYFLFFSHSPGWCSFSVIWSAVDQKKLLEFHDVHT